MFLQTVRSEGLAHLSYLLADEGAGVGAVIDPRRDVDIYLDLARERNVRITLILETHVHEDFVSGSRELAALTGAPIYAGVSEDRVFDHHPVKDGETIHLGSLSLHVFQTPGHTLEHVCYLVSGGKGAAAPWGIFTGDTLFAGDIGRTDLLGKDRADHCARKIYRSIFETLLPLGDELEIYPAHGKGSPCGGNIGDRLTSTLGYERRHNPKLQATDEDRFLRNELASLQPAPSYFYHVRQENVHGPRILGCLPPVPMFDPHVFEKMAGDSDNVVLDTREIEAFGGGHIRGALNIALREEFPLWAGWMLPPGQPIWLVLEQERDLDIVRRHLLRIGIDRIEGYLQRGMRGWYEEGLPFERMPEMSVQELKELIDGGSADFQLLDVRSPGEWESGHIPKARHIFLPELTDRLAELDRSQPIVTYCGSGYRASIAASLLERHGFGGVYNVPGSMKAWKTAGYPLSGGR